MIDPRYSDEILREANDIAAMLNSIGKPKTPTLALALLTVGLIAYRDFSTDQEELVSDLLFLNNITGEIKTTPKIH